MSVFDLASATNPLVDSGWDLSGGQVEDPSRLQTPSPGERPPADPPAYGGIRNRSDAVKEELLALGHSTASSLEEVVAAIRSHYPGGIQNAAINPYTGLPFTAATRRWAAG